MKRLIRIILLASFGLTSSYAQQFDYFVEEWDAAVIETNDSWRVDAESQGYYTIVEATTEKVHSGARAFKAQLYNPFKIFKRAELEHKYKAQIGEQYFYRFSVYLPSINGPVNYQDGLTFELIAQWHGNPDFSLGETWRSPNLGFYMNQEGNLKITTRASDLPVNDNGTCLYVAHQDGNGNDFFAIPKDQWVTFEVSVRWDWTANGFLDIWMDGEQIVQYDGLTSYNDAVGPYMKLGLYRTTWVTDLHVAYYDNLQILKNGAIIFPDRDTFVRGGTYENDNYGYNGTLIVKHNNSPYYLRQAYMHFDYSQYSAYSFSGADLLLNLSQSTTYDLLKVHRTGDAWSESQLTYASAQSLPVYAYQGSGDAFLATCLVPIPQAPSLGEISLRLSFDVHDAFIACRAREYSVLTERPMLLLRF